MPARGATAPSSTVGDLLAIGTRDLAAAGIQDASLDAELLVAEALGAHRAVLHARPEASLSPEEAHRARELLRRRAAREPVAYLLGRRAFRHLELAVDRRVLIPRPETELLVESALELPFGASVCDVGTGSGAVALAVKDERPDLRVSGVEPSTAALAVARANARALGLEVELTRGELPSAWPDMTVANLPYVREGEWDGLAPEITHHEPREALVAGPDGLAAIRGLVASAPAGARLALEHGADQGRAVRSMLEAALTRRDLAGRERVTVGHRPASPLR